MKYGIYKIITFMISILLVISCSTSTETEQNEISKIAYSAWYYETEDISSDDIFIIDLNGENKINLTFEIEEPAYNPVFSPDCKKIIFRSKSESSTDQIFSVNLDGSGLKNLSNNELYVFYHDVSSKGTKIVFGDVLSENIWIMNLDGSNQKNLTNSNGNWYPKISPDGKQVVFQKYGNSYHDDIYIIDADGNNLTQLTDITREDTWPQFSKDGNYILYLSTILHPDTIVDRFDIYRMDIDGSNKINLTDEIGSVIYPASSPDGQKVLFTLLDENDIYIMDIDGQNKKNITNGNGKDSLPQFTLDMDKIVFISEVNGNNELYIMDIDGSNRIRLTNTILNESDPICCY